MQSLAYDRADCSYLKKVLSQNYPSLKQERAVGMRAFFCEIFVVGSIAHVLHKADSLNKLTLSLLFKKSIYAAPLP